MLHGNVPQSRPGKGGSRHVRRDHVDTADGRMPERIRLTADPGTGTGLPAGPGLRSDLSR